MSESETELYRFPEFFERLEAQGLLRARDAIESETEVDGIVYHHRGLQMPAAEVTFIWNPEGADDPVFQADIHGLGERRGTVTFDARKSWDVFLMLYDGGACIAWMSDAEFDAEEAEHFPNKAKAFQAGRFSFAAVFLFGPDWVEREDWARESTAPAVLQLGDGRMVVPNTPAEFFEADVAIPEEFRDNDERPAPYFGVVEATLEGDPNYGQS